MFHMEYKMCQVPIVNFSIADTNMWLNDQIHKLLRAVYLFD